jgi:hypothetical protein
MHTYYVDESGYKGDWAFALVGVCDSGIPKRCLQRWRAFYKASGGRAINMPEYKDAELTDRLRKKMLSLIADEDVLIWGVVKRKYRGHVSDYSPVVISLLRLAGIRSEDTVVIVDKVERATRYMDKRIEEIRQGLGMPNLKILCDTSEKEKGIQLADAIAGAIGREYMPRPAAPSHIEIISKKIVKPVQVIE